MRQAPPSSKYLDAAAPGALQWVCAGDSEQIRAYFARKDRPYSQGLVREFDGSYCHVFYEPSLPGFRAAADDQPVERLYVHVDPLAFYAGRSEAPGDSLDVAAVIASRSPRPLKLTLALAAIPSEEAFRGALRQYFPASGASHVFEPHIAPSKGELAPWMQDFLKAGRAGDQERVLVTRRAFEGRADQAEKLDSLLASFPGPLFEHSKLSWEGGDLQFAAVPADPGKLVMFYGTSMKQYWGDTLTQEELEYVLRQEFGADEAVYLEDVTPHVDYLLSILPESRTALVSKPVCGDGRVARAAIDALVHHYGSAAPVELQQLSTLIPNGSAALAAAAEIRVALDRAEAARSTWRAPRDPVAEARILGFVQANCPGNPAACVAPEKLTQLLEQQPDLLKEWVGIGGRIRLTSLMNARMLELVGAQLTGCQDLVEKADRAADRVERLGFHVIRIPWLPAAKESRRDWAGISYANAALIDRTLFVPSFGLDPVEPGWFKQIQSELPAGYQLVPVPARFLMLENGGLHCAIAFGRGASGTRREAAEQSYPGAY
jgi:hypothetical protein